MANLKDLEDSIASLQAVKDAHAKAKSDLDLADAAIDISIARLTAQHKDILATLNAVAGVGQTQGVTNE